jgi:hypothetical protein
VRLVAALLAAIGVLGATAGTSLAAFQIIDLSAHSGPVGADVAVRIQISTRVGTTNPSQLFLVDKSTYRESAHCDEIRGAVLLTGMTWHAATLEFQGATYPGFVADGAFRVPGVSVGPYLLAETLTGIRGTGCHVFAPFDVVPPDTAMSRPRPRGVVLAAMLGVIAVAVLAATLGRQRLSRH